ncbi:MAG: PadR family transcriptional regulator [Sulfolobaceae archaeon]|nr:PadR family transcriptional regulator [Sulfolobaceae archaeon]
MKRGALKFMILSLLQEKPMYVYEIIKSINAKTNGLYKPSTGSIYPILRGLIKQGYVKVEEKDGKKIYSLTEEGRKKFEEIKAEKDLIQNNPVKRKLVDSLFEIGLVIYNNRDKLDDQKVEKILNIIEGCKKNIEEIFKK